MMNLYVISMILFSILPVVPDIGSAYDSLILSMYIAVSSLIVWGMVSRNKIYLDDIGKIITFVLFFIMLSSLYGVVVYDNDVSVSIRSVMPYMFLLNYFIVIYLLRTKIVSINNLCLVLVFCALVALIKSFVGADYGSWKTLRYSIDAIAFSPIVSMSFALAFSLGFLGVDKSKWFLMASFSLLLLMVMTTTRSYILVSFVIVLSVIYIKFKYLTSNKILFVITMLAVSFVGLFALSVTSVIDGAYDAYHERITNMSGGDRRIDEMLSAYKEFETSPFLGKGIGYEMKVYLDKDAGYKNKAYIHNYFGYILYSMGMIGLLITVGVLLYLLRDLRFVIVKSNNLGLRIYSISLVITLGVWIIHNQFNPGFKAMHANAYLAALLAVLSYIKFIINTEKEKGNGA